MLWQLPRSSSCGRVVVTASAAHFRLISADDSLGRYFIDGSSRAVSLNDVDAADDLHSNSRMGPAIMYMLPIPHNVRRIREHRHNCCLRSLTQHMV